MKPTPLALLYAALLAASVARHPLHAAVEINESVVSALIKTGDEPFRIDETSPLRNWPEEVTYSSPPRGNLQAAGTVLRNMAFQQQESEGPRVSFNSRVVGQMFQVAGGAGDQYLEKIFILARTSLPRETAIVLKLRLVDLGESPSMEEYAEGSNLFPSNPEVSVSMSSGKDVVDAQIVSFTFSGEDRLRLKEGNWYSFEIVLDPDVPKGAQFIWYRGIGLAALPDSPVFVVPFMDGNSIHENRKAIENRQTFIGIKTSPAG